MNEKILIVDDEKKMCEELKVILEDEGYQTETAYDGLEAVGAFKRNVFDLVLLDIKMPKMDGMEAYKKMKSFNSAIPVIVITGSFLRKKAEKVVQNGAYGIVEKPFEVEELLDKIAGALDHVNTRT